MNRRRLASSFAVAVVLLSACGAKSTSSSSSASSTTSPESSTFPTTTLSPGSPPFYATPQDLTTHEKGDLLASEPVTTLLGGTGTRILYVSTDQDDELVAVSGLVLVPDGAKPQGGWPVVSWAHPTVGLADSCAPSRNPLLTLSALTPAANQLGAIIVASDYQGLGTSGRHPFLNGRLAARNTLDAITAAGHAHETANSAVVLGYSQGGQAALFASQIAGLYAPNINLKGVAAIAPPTDLKQILQLQEAQTTADPGLAVAGLYGAAVSNESIDLATLLTPQAFGALTNLEDVCSDKYGTTFPTTFAATFSSDPTTNNEVEKSLADNSANPLALATPVYIAQGTNDATVPASVTEAFVAQACAYRAVLTYQEISGADHESAFLPATQPTLAWLGDRLNNVAATSNC